MRNPMTIAGNGLSVLAVGVLAALACRVAVAETVDVAPGETLVLNTCPDAFLVDSTNVVHAAAGSTLALRSTLGDFPAEGRPGFTVVHGVTFPQDAAWPAVGTSEAAALAGFRYTAVKDVEQTPGRVKIYQTGVADRQFDLYAAKWSVPADMTISLFEHFASSVFVVLDGTVVFSDTHWNWETARKDLSLAAGTHTLVIAVATQGQNACTPKTGNTDKNKEGRYGHANAQTVPGLVYNVNNATLTLDALRSGVSGVDGTRFFENVPGDAPFTTYVPALGPDTTLPEAFVLRPRVLADGGEVTLDLTGLAGVAQSFLMYGGLLATNGATVVVKGADTLRFGGASHNSDKHWSFYGAPVVFRHADGTDNAVGTVAFESRATVLAHPPRWTVAPGTSLALMGANVLGGGDVALNDFDVQLQAPGAVAEGASVTVGAGRTLSLKPCGIDPTDPWKWYGTAGAFTNAIVLGGSGATLRLPNVVPLDVWGTLSGAGTVEAEYEATSARTDAVTTFHGAATFEGTVRVVKGEVVFLQETPGAAGNTVRLEESSNWNDWNGGGQWEEHFGAIRLLPAGAGETETTARIARVEAKDHTRIDNQETGARTTRMNATVHVAKRQTMKIGTWNGNGRLQGDDYSDAGAGTSETEVGTLDADSFLRVLVRKRLSVGEMGSRSTVRCAPALERLEIGRMAAGATAIVQGSTAVTVGDGGAGEVILRDTTATHPLALGSLRRLTFESAATTVVTDGAIQSVCGTGTLVVSNGTVRLGNIAPGVNVKLVEGGRVVYAAQAVPGAYDLGEDIDPALWLDADAPADCFRQLSLKGHPNVVYTNGSVVIDKWFDVRPGQRDLYGFNKRCDGTDEVHQQVYPYLLKNACNGRTTLQFDRYGHSVAGLWSSYWVDDPTKTSRAGRRMPLNKPVAARYAVMVFGSENGGGMSVLGGWNVTEGKETYTTPGALPRFPADCYTTEALDLWKGKALKLATDWSLPIFAEPRPTWVDGAAVDPTTTGFNGRYQILSFQLAEDGSAVPVQCLGACGKDVKDSAGQIYGEVLVFTNTLTAIQRQRVERYLSRKWGIPLAGMTAETDAAAPRIDVVPGTSVELEDGGVGELVLAGSPALTLTGRHVATGVHAGSVALAGGTLDIPALQLPWSEADVATTKDEQMGWYDPDDASRYLDRAIANDTRPLAVDTLFSKFSGTTRDTYRNTTAFLHGYLGQADYSTADANNRADRRPWRATGVRGTGPSRTWLDFTAYPDGDRSGNCLRFKNAWSQTTELGNATRANQNFRTAFVVTDTSKGGGNVLCEASAGNMTPTKERKGYDPASPIWASGSRAAITGGKTYLDGVEVDGTKRGYTGRPELLTVAATADVLLSAVGYYNGKAADGTVEHSYETVGEMIFYKTALDEETRAGVESYLMRKWLGKVPAAFVDWRDATVSGTGAVHAPSGAYLPRFDAGFAGAVGLTDVAHAFGVDASGAVTNAVSLPAGADLVLPAAGTVSVAFANKPVSCDLMTAKTVTGADLAAWTFAVTPDTAKDMELKVVDLDDGRQALRLVVKGGGTLLIFR